MIDQLCTRAPNAELDGGVGQALADRLRITIKPDRDFLPEEAERARKRGITLGVLRLTTPPHH